MSERTVVHRIEDGMDRQQVACTTYQQRNFYTQMRDGYFSRNEVFNYVLHHQVARWAAQYGGHVLDVCCGRGLMLPLLRYHAKPIASYTGIDIRPENATWRTRRVTDGKPIEADYYPWPTYFVEGNVAHAFELVQAQAPRAAGAYGFIIYTAAIEHMHPEDGARSLAELHALAAPGAGMVLTCPNTPPGQDGYDARYRAHVYEWKLAELQEALVQAGWQVERTWGVDVGPRALREWAERAGRAAELEHARRFVPQEWLCPAWAPLVPPEEADEVGLLCVPAQQEHLF